MSIYPSINFHKIGWLANNSRGTIADSMYNAFESAEKIAKFRPNTTSNSSKSFRFEEHMMRLGFDSFISFDDWKLIDENERSQGRYKNKTRVKFSSIEAIDHLLH
ncbi:MAG: hypothetical protein MHPSP_000997 [Paramarteilia canceri]